jgi:hypothetical protein
MWRSFRDKPLWVRRYLERQATLRGRRLQLSWVQGGARCSGAPGQLHILNGAARVELPPPTGRWRSESRGGGGGML